MNALKELQNKHFGNGNRARTIALACLTYIFATGMLNLSIAIAQARQSMPISDSAHVSESIHFTKASDCALCHSFSNAASAMRDAGGRNVAPYDLWAGSMMANSAIDPYWRAAVSAEVVATPGQKSHIEEVCSRCHAPMAAPMSTSPQGQVLAFLNDGHSKSLLGRDGVSCTVCHQISSEKLGSEASFTGAFVLNKGSLIFGPHANPVTMPMQRHVGYTPTYGEHILRSEMCATCHTVITESFDARSEPTGVHLHEQVPYFEWRNSIFNTESDVNKSSGRSCQACHMPPSDGEGGKISTKLAHNPGGRDFPFLQPREPFGRHTFAGGNTFMIQLIRDHRRSLGLLSSAEAFDRVLQESRKMLQQQTAKVQLVQMPSLDKSIMLRVEIVNLTGHKFPTAYPSRRAWIELIIRDEAGKMLFASGRFNEQGQIIDETGEILVSEKANGPLQPHHQVISNSSQVQIYESLMEDTRGDLTFALLRGSRFKKDNRLLPPGWVRDHQYGKATLPQGISEDSDFLAGKDSTYYQIALPPGKYSVEARILFQSLSSRYMTELFEIETREIKSFQRLYSQSNLMPETIAPVKMELIVP